MSPYLSRAASLRLPSDSARSHLTRASSSCARTLRTSARAAFSSRHCAVILSSFVFSPPSSA